MAHYHPSDELLMQYAAGQLTNAPGIQTACHIEHCQICRETVARYERWGGELIHELPPVDVAEDTKAKLMRGIYLPDDSPIPPHQDKQYDPRIPAPLRRFIPEYYEHLPWSGISKSIQSYDLTISDESYKARLYKISAGQELPQHTHAGNEYTLVLSGSFSDKAGDYHPGDFVLADTTTHHQPRAHEKEDCICFAVMDAPLKLTGFFGRMLNPFIR